MNEAGKAPEPASKDGRRFSQALQANMVAGVLTLIPIVVTYFVFNFALNILSAIGAPVIRGLASLLERPMPTLAHWIERPIFLDSVSVLFVIGSIYFIGWLVSQFVGEKLLQLFDGLITRIPLVRLVYGSIKALLNVLQQRPDSIQRVVMIEFPNSEMKALGFVTRTLRDEATGRELAAVFVPTTPNPTGGYLEIVPIDRLVSTDWSFDEAMNFVISGGAIAPERIAFSQNASALAKKTVPASDA